jgi:hypothetical protein
MTIETWLQTALADAEQRGLPDLKPLLEALAKTTAALRASEITRAPGTRLRSADTGPSLGEAGRDR